MSWSGEKQRHSCASRGIKTNKKEQLKMGVKVEAEHQDTINRIITDTKAGKLKPLEYYQKMVAEDHLDEIKDYYTRLAKMEKEAGV